MGSNSRKPWQYGTRGYTGPGGMGNCQGQDGHLSWECHGTGQGIGCGDDDCIQTRVNGESGNPVQAWTGPRARHRGNAKLEQEGTALEKQFQGFVGCSWADLDLENLDVDFIEDLMLRAKPTNAILQDIRNRQIVKLEKVKDEYWEKIKDLGEEKKEVVEEINEVEKVMEVDESVPPIESANPA